MNHESLGKNKEGIMNNEGQMIPLPPPILFHIGGPQAGPFSKKQNLMTSQ